MTTLTVTAKGQITLNRDFLHHLGVHPGQRVEVRKLPNGRIQLALQNEPDFKSLKGLLHDPDRPAASLEDIDEAIAAGWSGEGR